MEVSTESRMASTAAATVAPTLKDTLAARGFAGRRVHFIGVGGCGMYGAARMLLQGGARLSGSDQKDFGGAGALVNSGAKVCIGHAGGHVDATIELVVRSAAVPDDNPEVVTARCLGIPVIKYAELLGLLTCTHRGVAICGTHGKSTTTAMVAHLLRHAGLDPSFIVGADSSQLGGNSGVGKGPHFVVEACEFGRSFLHLRPHSAAILNIEADHLDCYGTLDEIEEAFAAFAANVVPEGLLLVNHEDQRTKRAARRAACTVQSCGFGPGAYWRATNLRLHRGCYSFVLRREGRPLATCSLRIAGRHNVANALAGAALAAHAGAEPERIAEALATYEGVHRRMTFRGAGHGVTVIDDYAHHPTEIRATLAALRERYAPRRLWAVFQPHQASRTRLLMEEFVTAFKDADIVVVPDIYSVRDTEADRAAVTSATLVSRICSAGRAARYIPALDGVRDHLLENLAEGDLIVTMGAGDVWKVADGLVKRLC